MFYDFAVTVTAGKTEAAPKEQELKLTYGVIHQVEIEFPRGCKGYVYLALDHWEHQFLPTNPDEAFSGDGYVIVIKEHYPLITAPYSLYARAWAPSATYNHTITVRIGVLPESVLLPLKGLGAKLKKLITPITIGG
jgi:hypothetical protein